MLVGAGLIWHTAEVAATARAAWLAEPVPSDDDTEGISLTAGGFLDRDVVVTIYTFGEEDGTAEDFWTEEKSHGDFAEEFYKRGFRRVVASESKISRVIAPQSISRAVGLSAQAHCIKQLPATSVAAMKKLGAVRRKK
jgi:hypothetical protein